MCHGATRSRERITKAVRLATVVSLQDERNPQNVRGRDFQYHYDGKNTMMAYGPNIIVADRWAIIAYLRALQRSQNATVAMFLRTGARNSRNNERAFPHCPNTEGEYFGEQPLCRSLVAPRMIASVFAGLCVVGRHF